MEISNSLEIKLYFHCALCLDEIPEGESPESYANYSGGWTIRGFQIWCLRHDCNIVHVDFEGQQHPADITRKVIPLN